MPRSTVKYAFEHGLLAWASSFREGEGFFAVFGPTGQFVEVHMAHPTPSGKRLIPHERKEQLAQVHPSWLYFDPFDWPEYAWLEWHAVPQATLEKLIGEPWVQAFREGKGEFPELPESWGVMF
jgi:hypothetical protein